MFKLITPGLYKTMRIYQSEKALKQFGKEPAKTSIRIGMKPTLYELQQGEWVEVNINQYLKL